GRHIVRRPALNDGAVELVDELVEVILGLRDRDGPRGVARRLRHLRPRDLVALDAVWGAPLLVLDAPPPILLAEIRVAAAAPPHVDVLGTRGHEHLMRLPLDPPVVGSGACRRELARRPVPVLAADLRLDPPGALRVPGVNGDDQPVAVGGEVNLRSTTLLLNGLGRQGQRQCATEPYRQTSHAGQQPAPQGRVCQPVLPSVPAGYGSWVPPWSSRHLNVCPPQRAVRRRDASTR